MTGEPRRFDQRLFGHIKRPPLDPSWPDSWRYSYGHDVDSVWPGKSARGYRVAYRHRFARAIDYVLEAKPTGGRAAGPFPHIAPQENHQNRTRIPNCA